jgi:hypothetical protein
VIRAALVLLGTVACAGCAGTATYSVKPFYEPNLQKMVCCEALAINGKDISALTFDLTTSAENVVTVHFQETGVNATAPIAANAVTASAVAGAVSNAAISAAKILH